MHVRPLHPSSVPSLTNGLVAEWTQFPSATFQTLMDSLPIRVEITINAKETKSRTGSSTNTYGCDWLDILVAI